MHWLSLDVADGETGAVLWENDKPLTVARLSCTNHKETKKLPERRGHVVYLRNLESGEEVAVPVAHERAAWSLIRNHNDITYIVIEAGHVHWPGAAMKLAEARGRALALLGAFGSDAPEVIRVAPASWRKGVRAMLSVDIPAKRDAAKKAAVEIVRQLLGFVITDDEAEAYLLGRWAWWARKVEL